MNPFRIVKKSLGQIICRHCGYAYNVPHDIERNMVMCPQCNRRNDFA